MSAYYDLYETPDVQNTGEKQPLHARIVPSGTYSQKEFIERVSRYQHFPQNMVDGVLGAVIDELGSLLARGYIVELGELGHLSVSLKCTQKVMTKKEIRSESICFDNVHLRTSKNFKLKVRREMRLERVPKSGRTVSKTDTYRATSSNVTGVSEEEWRNHPHRIQQTDRSSPAESC